MKTSVRETLSTEAMAKALGISQKLLLRLRKQPGSPFQLGIHYRFQGISTAAPVRWFPAPTDEAFSRIPEAQLQALLADKAALTEVLTYHVVPGEVMAADVVKLTSARTVQGESVSINTMNGGKVDTATVIQTDIETSNGVIHVIDTVILPRSITGS